NRAGQTRHSLAIRYDPRSRSRVPGPSPPVRPMPHSRARRHRPSADGRSCPPALLMEVALMTTLLESLSNELATAVEAGGRAVVAIHARRRIPASGVHWRQGVIVATNHTINRDEKITVTLPDGTTAPATLAGRDPSTARAV